VNQPRGTQRYHLTRREDEDELTHAITDLATQYGPFGHRLETRLKYVKGHTALTEWSV